MAFWYFLIGLLASVVGAISGLGGGVFIKPILDFLGDYPVATIGVFSSTTVFTMSAVSLWTRRRELKGMNKKSAFMLAIGSILGGLTGKGIFTTLLGYDWIGAVQTIMLIIVFGAALFYVQFKDEFPRYHIKDLRVIFAMGLGLGILSAFLDIGGGPHNIALLSLFFAMNAKKAALYSLFIICFSQLSSISIMLIDGAVFSYDLSLLPGMIIGGVLGGALGSSVSKWVSIRTVEIVFKVALGALIILSIYNLFDYI